MQLESAFGAFSRLLFGVSHFNLSEGDGDRDADGCWMDMEVMCEGRCFEAQSSIGSKMVPAQIKLDAEGKCKAVALLFHSASS